MMSNDYTVGEFMSRDIVSVRRQTTAMDCANVMIAEKVSSVLVITNHTIEGILTEKDLARKIVAKGLNPMRILVSDIMTREVLSAEPETSLYDAMVLMNQRKIKHLPIVKKGVPVGMITAMDILKVQPAYVELLSTPEPHKNLTGI